MSARVWRRAATKDTTPWSDVRNLRRLRTAVRSGLRGVWGAPLIFALSVITMAAGLLLLAGYLVVVQNVRAVLASYGADLSLVAFIRPNPEAGQTRELAQKLKALSGVTQVTFVSPEQALGRLRVDLGSDAAVLDGLSRNPMPGSFEIALAEEARTPERVKALAREMRALPAVDDVRYGEAWVESYARIVDALEYGGAGLGVCLVLVLGVIVSGTVRLAVHARADELQIQRLVGAGAFLVRLPFYLEAGLQGALGAALALALLYGLLALGLPLLGETLERLLGVATVQFFGALEVVALLLLGTVLGVGSAVLSLARLDEAP